MTGNIFGNYLSSTLLSVIPLFKAVCHEWLVCLCFFCFFPQCFQASQTQTLIAVCSQFLIKPFGVNARLKVSVPKNSTPSEKQGYMSREPPGMELSC